MNVTICSAFRNAAAYLPRYFAQVSDLRAALDARGDKLVLVVGEGDSADNTHELLYAALVEGQYEATVLDVTHGGPEHGSIVHPVRFKQFAYVWHEIWTAIQPSADIVVFCEADLIWQPETLLALLDQLGEVEAIAPMIMLQRRGYPPPYFYDAWGFRKNGKQFSPTPPYFAGWPVAERTAIDSAGSLVAMRAEYARQSRWREDDLIVGICSQIYEMGGSLWLDPSLSAIHL